MLEALHILESYRVVLLQRPPLVPPELTRLLFDEQPSGDNQLQYPGALQLVFTPGASINELFTRHSSLTLLATISMFAFPIAPSASRAESAPPLWTHDFVGLALNNWARIAASKSSWPSLLLFHMVYIRINANLDMLQHMAWAQPTMRSTPSSTSSFDSARTWFASPQYTTARWHAESVLVTTRRNLLSPRDSNADVVSSMSDEAHTARFAEPPHASFCVYYATLIAWSGAVLSEESKIIQEMHLDAGITLLGLFRSRVSKFLGQALREAIR